MDSYTSKATCFGLLARDVIHHQPLVCFHILAFTSYTQHEPAITNARLNT